MRITCNWELWKDHKTAVHSIGRPWHICRQFKRVWHQSQDFSDGYQVLQPMHWCPSSRHYAWRSWRSASSWGKTRSPALCWVQEVLPADIFDSTNGNVRVWVNAGSESSHTSPKENAELWWLLTTTEWYVCYMTLVLENVEHCGGEPEQAAYRHDIGFITSK